MSDLERISIAIEKDLIYDHTQRELSDRLVTAAHHHHGNVLASMHVHLDEANCLEVTAVRGRLKEIRHLGEHMIGMKGVRHGKVVITSTRV